MRGDIITYTTGAIITRSYNNNEEEEEEAKHDWSILNQKAHGIRDWPGNSPDFKLIENMLNLMRGGLEEIQVTLISLTIFSGLAEIV